MLQDTQQKGLEALTSIMNTKESSDPFSEISVTEADRKVKVEKAAAEFSTVIKQFVRAVFYFTCGIMLIVQVRACVLKLMYPPISSKVSVVLNRTLWYPSLTVCPSSFNSIRTSALPPFTRRTANGTLKTHFNTLSFWTREFLWNDGNAGLQEIYEAATWNLTEIVSMLTLNEKYDMIKEKTGDEPGKWVSRLSIRNGMCHTFIPDSPSETEKTKAYEVQFVVPKDYHKDYLNFEWDIFITDPGELYMDEYGYFRPVNRISISSGDELQGTIALRSFNAKDTVEHPCVDEPKYVATTCGMDCLWEEMLSVAARFGNGSVACRFPWMNSTKPEIMAVPLCKTSAEASGILSMLYRMNTSPEIRRALGLAVNVSMQEQLRRPLTFPRSLLEARCEKHCPRHCLTKRYEVSILSRGQYNGREDADKGASLQLHYASNEIFEVEEYYGYEYSSFVGEIGGSLGLLVGASVITLYQAFELAVDLGSAWVGKGVARAIN